MTTMAVVSAPKREDAADVTSPVKNRRERRRCVLLLDEEEVPGDVLTPTRAPNPPRRPASPAPLGLFAFGMVTIFFNLYNVGLISMTTTVLGAALVLGGIVQFVVGILAYFHGNTFAYVTFSAYAAFWLSIACLTELESSATRPDLVVDPTTPHCLAFYFGMWGVFTLLMFLASFSTNFALIAVFGSLTAFFALMSTAFFTHSFVLRTAAGGTGIFSGACAVYAAFAEFVNEVYARELLPVLSTAGLCCGRRPAAGNTPDV